MSRIVYEIWDLQGNPINNIALENLPIAPPDPTLGRVYFDTSLQQIGVCTDKTPVVLWQYMTNETQLSVALATKVDYVEGSTLVSAADRIKWDGNGVVYVVSHIVDRDAIVGMKVGDQCIVQDTDGNSSNRRTGYYYDGSSWILDSDTNWANVNLSWANISDKPTNLAIQASPAVSGQILVDDGNGNPSDSGKSFNNAGTTQNDVWDAAQILASGNARYELKGQLDSLHNLGLLQGNIEDLGLYWHKIVCDPSNLSDYQAVYQATYLGNGVVIAGSYGGNGYGLKVFRSTDYGQTFPETITLEIIDNPSTTFQILNLENGIALIGSGNGNGKGNVWRTTDYGQTWTKIVLDPGINNVFCFSNLGEGVVLAGTGGDAGEGNIWRSSNYGLTWTKIDIGLFSISNITYLGNKRAIFVSVGDLYETIDNGLTWTLTHSFNDQLNTSAYLGSKIILLGAESGNIYRSVDGGITYQLSSVAPTSIRYFTYISCGVTFYTTSAIQAGAGLYKSTDNGETWTSINIPGVTGTVDFALKMSYAGNGLMFLATGDNTGGFAAIYRSSITDIYKFPEILSNIKEIQFKNNIVFTDGEKEKMPVGTRFWDEEHKTTTLKTGEQTYLQDGQEFVVPVINNTLSTQLNGKVVRITGISGHYKEVTYSDNSTVETAVFDGVLTQDIEPGQVGFMTMFGELHDEDTTSFSPNDTLYLGTNGNITNVEPVSPNYVRIIGKVGEIGVNGSILVRYTDSTIGDITEANKAMNMPHGIPLAQKNNIVLSYNQTTRKVTVSGSFYYYVKTIKHIHTGDTELTAHSDITGIYYVMFDSTGVLKISDTIWSFGNDVPVCMVIYNNVASSTFWTGTKGILLCERHGCEMDKATHAELHRNVGCYATSGFALAGYSVATGSGGLTANSYSIDSGYIYDEDNSTLIPSLTDNQGVGNVYRVWYKLGTQWFWFDNNLPYLFQNTNILRNAITAGSGSLVEQTSQDVYMNMWIVGMPILDNTTGQPISYSFGHIIGQNNYSTLALAQASSFFDLDLSGIPAQEIAPLWQIIYKSNNSYDDNGNCRIESVRRIVGTRFVNGTQAVFPSVHNNLSGRSSENCHPSLAISTPALSLLPSLTVEGQLSQINAILGNTKTPMNTGNTYCISDSETSDTWVAGKKNFKTFEGFVAQLDTNILRYYTRTGTTTTGSAVIPVVDTSNLTIGQRLTGPGVPYDSFVQDIVTNTSVTINNTCTASATVTITNWIGIYVRAFGRFNVTASLTNLDGVYFVDMYSANIVYGNFPLFNQTVSRLTPFVCIGGNYIGTGTNSRFFYKYNESGNHYQYNTDFIYNINCYSKCTSELIYSSQNTGGPFGKFKLINSNLESNGTIMYVESETIEIVGGYRYGLLGGITLFGWNINTSGINKSSTNYAYRINRAAYLVSNDMILGNIFFNSGLSAQAVFNGVVIGDVSAGTNNDHTIKFNKIQGNVTTLGQIDIKELKGTFSQNGTGISRVERMYGSLTMNGGGEVTVYDKWRVANGVINITVTNGIVNLYGDYGVGSSSLGNQLSIASSGVFNLFGNFACYNVSSLAGKLNLKPGSILSTWYKNAAITGELNIDNAKVLLNRAYPETSGATPTFPISTGSVFIKGGSAAVSCPHADSKSGLFQKVGVGGRIIMKGYPTLLVSNGLSPIQILEGSDATRYLEIVQANSNCDGSTYGLKLIFSDTTYGTTYVPIMKIDNYNITENILID